jgi:hypothetical protein
MRDARLREAAFLPGSVRSAAGPLWIGFIPICRHPAHGNSAGNAAAKLDMAFKADYNRRRRTPEVSRFGGIAAPGSF